MSSNYWMYMFQLSMHGCVNAIDKLNKEFDQKLSDINKGHYERITT